LSPQGQKGNLFDIHQCIIVAADFQQVCGELNLSNHLL
jgi:hypothetical protein